MKKTIILALISLLTISNIVAQDNDTTIIDRNINIEKEYIPEIEEAEAQKFNIKTQEPNVPEAQFNYSTHASDVQPQSNFYPLDPQEQAKPKRQSQKQGYAEFGLATLSIGVPNYSIPSTTRKTPISTYTSTTMVYILNK